MDQAPTFTLTTRFAAFFKFLSQHVGQLSESVPAGSARSMLPTALKLLILSRLRRLGSRLAALARASHPDGRRVDAAARVAARPRLAPERALQGVWSAREDARTVVFPALPALPRRFAWLAELLGDAAEVRTQLIELLADGELAALVAAEPRLQRVLRPLAHMMGVAPHPELVALHARPARACAAGPDRARSPRPWTKRSDIMAVDHPQGLAGLRAKPG